MYFNLKKNKNTLIIIICVLFILLICYNKIKFIFFQLYNLNNRQENFQQQSNKMKQYNVIFAGCCKNVEPFILDNLNNIENCSKKFNDYAVVIYENDSTDKTREILINNKKDNYYYIFEDDIKEPLRTVRLANGRNKILNFVKDLNKNNYYDYLVVLDLDNVNSKGKFINSIDSCFEHNEDGWDVLTGNQSKYYDYWAFRQSPDFDNDYWKDHDIIDLDKWNNISFNEKNTLTEVNSAFGGIAIYKLRSIPNHCYYKGLHDDNTTEKCEHVEFNECIKNSGNKIYVNSKFFTDDW